MNKLDARGLSCPEPVIMIQKAMSGQEASYEMLVDNSTAKENVTRYAEHQGYSVEVQTQGGDYLLVMKK
ncbi:MAG: sulfurtransferase TusA family protein [Lachnospiraceae bacterium]|nr:sulfurtransferase TusA family protein [Lachnospiraceae bacterium]